MATTELNTKFGVHYRLYIASSDTPTADADYKRVKNETKISLKTTNKSTEVETKENGGQIATLPGPTQYELTLEASETYSDDGLPLLKNAIGKLKKYQIRYVKESADGGDTGGTVEMEGTFLAKDSTQDFEASGATKFQITLSSAGDVVTTSRPVGGTTPPEEPEE